VTAATDVYGLGAVLYHLLTGRPPFAGATHFETMKQVQEQLPELPTKLNAAVPMTLEKICLRCLAKTPAERYASAKTLAEELDVWLRQPDRTRVVDAEVATRPYSPELPATVDTRESDAGMSGLPKRSDSRLGFFLNLHMVVVVAITVGLSYFTWSSQYGATAFSNFIRYCALVVLFLLFYLIVLITVPLVRIFRSNYRRGLLVVIIPYLILASLLIWPLTGKR
jgi:serine/threonine protein kinase